MRDQNEYESFVSCFLLQRGSQWQQDNTKHLTGCQREVCLQSFFYRGCSVKLKSQDRSKKVGLPDSVPDCLRTACCLFTHCFSVVLNFFTENSSKSTSTAQQPDGQLRSWAVKKSKSFYVKFFPIFLDLLSLKFELWT